MICELAQDLYHPPSPHIQPRRATASPALPVTRRRPEVKPARLLTNSLASEWAEICNHVPGPPNLNYSSPSLASLYIGVWRGGLLSRGERGKGGRTSPRSGTKGRGAWWRTGGETGGRLMAPGPDPPAAQTWYMGFGPGAGVGFQRYIISFETQHSHPCICPLIDDIHWLDWR